VGGSGASGLGVARMGIVFAPPHRRHRMCRVHRWPAGSRGSSQTASGAALHSGQSTSAAGSRDRSFPAAIQRLTI
jgi:hypothetical protein